MEKRKSLEIAILGAVPGEVEPLYPLLGHPREIDLAGNAARTGIHLGKTMLIGLTGLGKVNAAITTATLLERFSAGAVWNIGSAGAYAGAHLQIGDVIITDQSIFGDEGVLMRNGVLSARSIGIPVLSGGAGEFHDRLPSNLHPMYERIRMAAQPGPYRILAESSPGYAIPHIPAAPEATPPPDWREAFFTLAYGPSLTVGMASGDPEVAAQRYERHRACAENMEGSAVAHACLRFDTPVIECRGIANIAGNRDREQWNVDLALRNCHGIVLRLLQELRGRVPGHSPKPRKTPDKQGES